ncbi:MAG: acetyl-CoA hydrolase [Alphaproteobacteria bacterium]|nr:acetyl-CoA hydrolase [Alphaproteobacteria bacterium]
MSASPDYHTTADALVDAVIDEVGKDIVLGLPLGLGKANHIANALFERAVADSSITLRIFTALTLEPPAPAAGIARRFTEPLVERLFKGYPALAYARAIREGRLPPNVTVNEFFLQAGRWLGVGYAQQNYISANYTHAVRYMLDAGVNVVAQLVAKRTDASGTCFSLSCNPDITVDLLPAFEALRKAGGKAVLLGQVNSELPYMAGEAEIDDSAFAHILEAPHCEFPLFAPPKPPVGLTDHALGLHVARLVKDGGTLQIGIGSIADAVAHALVLRHRNSAAFGNAVRRLTVGNSEDTPWEDGPFTEGLYGASEMLVDAFLSLIDAGIIKRQVEDGALLHAAFFLGPRAFYRTLREMPEETRDRIRMTSVSFVNELYGDVARKRRDRVHARFVNNAMMATLQGAVVSDGLEDGRVVSGVGGQYNFVAQAFALEDARSVITLNATREERGRTVSNIRYSYGHVTIPRHLRDIIITEYGIADLWGKSDRDVIAAMLSITDSRFQEELLATAKSAGKIERDHEIAPVFRDNTPARIRRALGPARAQGLFPDFPFGTDFTEAEQRLMPALHRLKSISGSKLCLAQMLLAGISQRPNSKAMECLERMDLTAPKRPTEFLHRALLLGALAATTAES